jgi:hypothetical protein
MNPSWVRLLLRLLRTPDYVRHLAHFFSTRYLVYDPEFLCRTYAGERPIAGFIPYTEEFCWITDGGKEPVVSLRKIREFELGAQPNELKLFQGEAYSHFKKQGKFSHDSSTVRLHSLTPTPQGTVLTLQKAKYSDQVQSNLVMDWSGRHGLKRSGTATLRTFLGSRYGEKLPPLTERVLANTIGVSVILFYKDGLGAYVPYLPKRLGASFQKKRRLAVFEGGYHCTASGAVEWSNANTFDELFSNDMLRELEEEVGIVASDLEVMVPVALCREFLRGGKPQIFFAGITKLAEEELEVKRHRALRKQMVLSGKVELEGRHLRASNANELEEQLIENPLSLEATANLYYAMMFMKRHLNDQKNETFRFFPAGSDHDAYVRIRRVIISAKRDLLVIDPYAGDLLWALLRNVPLGIRIRVLASKAKSDFLVEAKKFVKQYGHNVQVRLTPDYHDRFIIADGTSCWHLGTSIQHAGSRAFVMSKLQQHVARTVEMIEKDWTRATPQSV